MVKVDVRCPFCQQTPPVKTWIREHCHQRYRCKTVAEASSSIMNIAPANRVPKINYRPYNE